MVGERKFFEENDKGQFEPVSMADISADQRERIMEGRATINTIRAESGLKAEITPPVVNAYNNLYSTMQHLDGQLTQLLNRVEPLLGPDMREEKYNPEDASVPQIEGSEMTRNLRRLERELDMLSYRIAAVMDRIEI